MQEKTKDEKEFKINIIEIYTHKVKEIGLEKELVLMILNMMMDIIIIVFIIIISIIIFNIINTNSFSKPISLTLCVFISIILILNSFSSFVCSCIISIH